MKTERIMSKKDGEALAEVLWYMLGYEAQDEEDTTEDSANRLNAWAIANVPECAKMFAEMEAKDQRFRRYNAQLDTAAKANGLTTCEFLASKKGVAWRKAHPHPMP